MNKFYFFGYLKGAEKRVGDVMIIESQYDKPLISYFIESEKRKKNSNKREGVAFSLVIGYGSDLIDRIDKSLKELLKMNGKDKESWVKAVKENLPAIFESGDEFDVLSENFSLELWNLVEFIEEAKKYETIYPKQKFETVEEFYDRAIRLRNKYNKE